MYKARPTVFEQEAAIFIGTLIKRTNGFKRALSSGETAELILLYTIIPKERDLKKPAGIPKFAKAKNWKPSEIPELSKITISKISNSRTSSWNTLGISEDTLGVNYIGLNEENNPWK